jgi:hypothetical protein
MKKINLLLVIILSVLSFNSFGQKLYEGMWVDKHKEFQKFSIIKEGGDLWYKSYSGKYKIEEKDNSYFVKMETNTYDLKLDTDRGILFLGKTEFIPEFKSFKRQFSGVWKSKSSDTTFDIESINGGITWDIIKSKEKPVRFYPKLTDTGFTFTYGDKQLFFSITEEYMEDSDGNKYIKISE